MLTLTVLNVFYSCYLNQLFCKFWIYFSKYYRPLGSWSAGQCWFLFSFLYEICSLLLQNREFCWSVGWSHKWPYDCITLCPILPITSHWSIFLEKEISILWKTKPSASAHLSAVCRLWHIIDPWIQMTPGLLACCTYQIYSIEIDHLYIFWQIIYIHISDSYSTQINDISVFILHNRSMNTNHPWSIGCTAHIKYIQ